MNNGKFDALYDMYIYILYIYVCVCVCMCVKTNIEENTLIKWNIYETIGYFLQGPSQIHVVSLVIMDFHHFHPHSLNTVTQKPR